MKSTFALIFGLNFYLASAWLSKAFNDGPEKVKQKVLLQFSPDSIRLIEFPLEKLPDLFYEETFNASRPMVIYFHGWQSDVKAASVLAMRQGYFGYNIVTVDWSEYAGDYLYNLLVIPQLKVIAQTFAELLLQFLEKGYNIEQLHLAGHSLGGQAVGKISRSLTKISRGKYVLPLIVALDPAGPGFEVKMFESFSPISNSDARVVQIIHSSTLLGMNTQAGTIDFFPNGGNRQPGCERLLLSNDGCNHSRAWQFYQAALRNPTGFPAVRCASYDDYLRINKGGNCNRNEIVYMGLNANRNATGKYFMQTNGNKFKFSKGMSGLSPSQFLIRGLKTKIDRDGSDKSLNYKDY